MREIGDRSCKLVVWNGAAKISEARDSNCSQQDELGIVLERGDSAGQIVRVERAEA
jgi:hypothetical protein